MAAFTTTSRASGFVINTMIVIAIFALAGLTVSSLIAYRAGVRHPLIAVHASADTVSANIKSSLSY